MPLKMNSHLNTTYFEDFLYIEKQCSSYIYIISMMFISLVPIIMICRCAVLFCFEEPENIDADRDRHIKNIDRENIRAVTMSKSKIAHL